MALDDLSAPARCPVNFDHDSPEHAKHWQDEYRQMRETCPRAWTESHGGYWVATKHKDLVAVAQSQDFTAHKDFDPETGEVKGGVTIPPLPAPRAVPHETESPEWNSVRTFLNPRFSPKVAEARRSRAKQFAAALIDNIIEKGKFDIVEDFTNPLPALVTMDVFGFPLEEWRTFAEPFHKMVSTAKTDPEFPETLKWLDHFRFRVGEEVADRRRHPKDDLLNLMANGEINGERLSDDMIQSMAFQILAAGVDTTTALTSNALLYLSRNPDQRQRLIDHPELMPYAREEFVRYFSPVQSLARTAKDDVVVNGWEFQRGERVLLTFASANRDPEIFDKPEEVILDRFPNRHVGFGAGMHRCLGSFLARIMFDAMISEMLERMPDFTVVEDEALPYESIAIINGWVALPTIFTPGAKVGAAIA